MNSALETFVPLQFKRKKGKLLVDGRDGGHDVRIIEAVARAMHWHALLDSGAFKSVVEIAKAEGLMPTTVGRLLRLARLAPDIIEQLMQGCQPRRLTLLWLMRNDIPALWPELMRSSFPCQARHIPTHWVVQFVLIEVASPAAALGCRAHSPNSVLLTADVRNHPDRFDMSSLPSFP